MLGLIVSQVRHRAGRACALPAALLIAVTSFAVLSGDARGEQTEVVGTVGANDRGCSHYRWARRWARR